MITQTFARGGGGESSSPDAGGNRCLRSDLGAGCCACERTIQQLSAHTARGFVERNDECRHLGSVRLSDRADRSTPLG